MKENPIWCIKLGLLWSADCIGQPNHLAGPKMSISVEY